MVLLELGTSLLKEKVNELKKKKKKTPIMFFLVNLPRISSSTKNFPFGMTRIPMCWNVIQLIDVAGYLGRNDFGWDCNPNSDFSYHNSTMRLGKGGTII